MSKVFDFSGVDGFCHGGLLYPNPKQSSLFSAHARPVDVYFPPGKRSRVSAPYVVSEEQRKQTSIEVLPDECLFEVFRRIPGGQERSACAGVSKRWLMLLSSIRTEELCIAKSAQCDVPETKSRSDKEDDSSKPKEKGGLSDSNGMDFDDDCQETISQGHLSRCLEGKKATDIRLAAIAVGTAARGGLGKLSIRGSVATRGLSNLGLKAISHGCPSLRVLSLWNLSSVGDEGLCEIASGIHSLEKLDLSHCSAITDKGLIAIAENSHNLMSVTLESCPKIGNDSLQALGRHCPNLRCITVKNCPLVGDQGVAGLLSSAGHILTKVKFQALNITDVSLAVIGHYGKTIVDLALISLPNVNERGFWVMGKGQGLQQMKSLSITACGGVSDKGIEALGQGCPSLKTFGLRKCPFISDNGLMLFAKAAELLESLHLEECHRVTQYGVIGTLANCGDKLKSFALVNCLGMRDLSFGFPLTSRCNSLRWLTINNCPGFGDVGLSMLSKLCPSLTHMDLSGLEAISDAGLLPLVHCTDAGFEKLNLSGCVNVTDNVVNAISKLHGDTLELLNLDGCRCITDLSLMAIAQNCSVLSELDVSRCGITDSGIAILARAERLNLQIFSLAGCFLVSDKSLCVLKVLGRTLVGLNIQNCRAISSTTIDILLEHLWRCDILY